MKLSYKKFIRQAKYGPASLTAYLASMAKARNALINDATWVSVPDGSQSEFPPVLPSMTASSPKYDAYMFGGDCTAASGRESAFMGMAAYVFKIPTAAQTAAAGGTPTKITAVDIKGFADKFLWKGAVYSWCLTNAEAVPAEVTATLPYAGLSSTGIVFDDADSGTKLASNKYDAFALYADPVGLSVSGKTHIVIVVQLADYLQAHWEYWIEGAACLDVEQTDFTFADTVTPDAPMPRRNAQLADTEIYPVDAEASDASDTEGNPTWDAYRCHMYSERADVLTEPYKADGGGDLNGKLIMDRVVDAGANFLEDTFTASPVPISGGYSAQLMSSVQYFFFRAACKSFRYHLPEEVTANYLEIEANYLGTQAACRVIVVRDMRGSPTPLLDTLSRLQQYYVGKAPTGDVAAGVIVLGNVIIPSATRREKIKIPITPTTGIGLAWVVTMPYSVACIPVAIPVSHNSFLGDGDGLLSINPKTMVLTV